nr:tRNA-dihydrouridine synthase family protein [Desulfobulbaceae bacterium]
MGITDAVYRQTFAKYFDGFDCAIAPFVCSVSSRKLKPNYLKDLFPERNTRLSVTPQVLSKNAEDFLFIAEKIGELGYTSINWNLGCPVQMVAKKRRGSGLLPYPDQIDSILEQVCAKWPHGLSIKTRLGRNSPEEILVLLKIFDRYPLKELIIHPRLGVQMYKGDVDLTGFGNCLAQTSHQVVYNGDITNEEFLLTLKDRFPALNRWMIGRAALSNPFLADSCRGTGKQFTAGSHREILVQFHNDLFKQYNELLFGPSHLLGKMKAIWNYLGQIFDNSDQIIKKIQKSTRIDQYNDYVVFLFETEKLALE